MVWCRSLEVMADSSPKNFKAIDWDVSRHKREAEFQLAGQGHIMRTLSFSFRDSHPQIVCSTSEYVVLQL